MELDNHARWMPDMYLRHPRHWPAYERAMLSIDRRGPEDGHLGRMNRLYWHAAYGRGYFEKGLSYLSDDPRIPPEFGACRVMFARERGIPLELPPREALPFPSELEASDPLERLDCAGIHAAQEGRWADQRRVLELLRVRAEEEGPEAWGVMGAVHLQEALRAWKTGEAAAALRTLEEMPRESRDALNRWLLAQLYLEHERWQDAVQYLRSFWWTRVSHADYYLGQAYEKLDRPEEAGKAYARFIAAWEDADPELQPFVESARRALERLTGERGA